MARGLSFALLLIATTAFGAPRGWHRLEPAGVPDTIVGFGVEAEGDTTDAALLVCRCREGQLELFVIPDSIGRGPNDDVMQREVETRIDTSLPRRENWTLSTDGGSLFAPDPRGLAPQLLHAGRLWLAIPGARPIEFGVRGFEEPWHALLASCPDTSHALASPHLQFGQYVYVEELPEAISKVSPVYPPEARQSRMEGTVIVQALIGKDGTVLDTKVVKSVPVLDAAAAESVRHWTFKPAMANGHPVEIWVAVPVKFSLQ